MEQAHLDSGSENFFAWARAQQPDYFNQLLSDIVEVKREDVEGVMRDHGDTTDFRVLNLGGGECAGASQVMIGANFFEAAHEREYRNALVFQRKYDEAAHCVEAILRLLGSGLAQMVGGVRQDDLTKLVSQLGQLVPGELATEYARLVGLLRSTPEMNDAALQAINRAVDAWTVRVGEFCSARDGQLDLSEALPKISVHASQPVTIVAERIAVPA